MKGHPFGKDVHKNTIASQCDECNRTSQARSKGRARGAVDLPGVDFIKLGGIRSRVSNTLDRGGGTGLESRQG